MNDGNTANPYFGIEQNICYNAERFSHRAML